MSSIPSTISNTGTSSSGVPRSINDLDLSVFLNLMITELQNQDPLNPLENKDMLAQISQLREVGATDQLTQTLNSVLLGQNIASATNLIGADISALSIDGQNIEGNVRRVEILKGSPTLHIEQSVLARGISTAGNVEAGEYNYRVAWQDDDGKLWGIELSGDDAVTTTGKEGVDQSIRIDNLPATTGLKQIYRTDANGEEPYRLVGQIHGQQSSFVDSVSDADRSNSEFDRWHEVHRSTNTTRSYQVKLENVRDIRPPK